MTRTPKQRFSRLAHDAPGLSGATTTFLSAENAPPITPETHGVIASVAASDPDRADRITEGLRTLTALDHRVMQWLEADADHARTMANDPELAVRTAIPELPADFFERWKR